MQNFNAGIDIECQASLSSQSVPKFRQQNATSLRFHTCNCNLVKTPLKAKASWDSWQCFLKAKLQWRCKSFDRLRPPVFQGLENCWRDGTLISTTCTWCWNPTGGKPLVFSHLLPSQMRHLSHELVGCDIWLRPRKQPRETVGWDSLLKGKKQKKTMKKTHATNSFSTLHQPTLGWFEEGKHPTKARSLMEVQVFGGQLLQFCEVFW